MHFVIINPQKWNRIHKMSISIFFQIFRLPRFNNWSTQTNFSGKSSDKTKIYRCIYWETSMPSMHEETITQLLNRPNSLNFFLLLDRDFAMFCSITVFNINYWCWWNYANMIISVIWNLLPLCRFCTSLIVLYGKGQD